VSLWLLLNRVAGPKKKSLDRIELCYWDKEEGLQHPGWCQSQFVAECCSCFSSKQSAARNQHVLLILLDAVNCLFPAAPYCSSGFEIGLCACD
jgi:hypothetical protein